MINAFLAAIQFLTVIPVPARAGPTPAAAAVLFPLVGGLLGALAVALWSLLGPLFSPSLLVLLILALCAALTGGLHEDGLADTFDAFRAGRSREEILRILKDSRIGAFGALALVFSILIRWQALVELPPAQIQPALLASQVLPRAGIVLLAYSAGGASRGLGGALADALTGWHVVAAGGLALALTVPLLKWDALAPVTLCLAVIALSRGYYEKKIGGITGDCLGAANQLQELSILVTYGRL